MLSGVDIEGINCHGLDDFNVLNDDFDVRQHNPSIYLEHTDLYKVWQGSKIHIARQIG